MHKVLALILLVICVASFGRNTVDRTIVRVNEDILTESDLLRIASEGMGSLSSHVTVSIDNVTSSELGALLDRTLLMQAAKLRKIEPPEADMQRQVESMIGDIRTRFTSEADFRRALASDQLTLEELKQQLLKRARSDYQVYQLVNMRFSITEADARKYESECTARGEVPLSLHLRRLAVPVAGGKGRQEKACNEVRELAATIFEQGLSFEDGIRKYSKAPGAKEDGGDLGYLSPDKLSSQVAEATRNLEPGQASTPIVTGGYASIFYVESKHGARSLLMEKKFTENREALLKELRRKANVQIFDPRLLKILPQAYEASLKNRAPSLLQPAAAAATPASTSRPARAQPR